MVAIPWIIAAVGAMGAMKQAQTASDNAKADAAALEFNATVARQQASTALSESAAAQMAQRRQASQVMARSRAAAVQSGVGTGGSTGDVLGQSATLAELDMLNIAYEGEMKSRGYLTQSSLDLFNAGRARRNAKDAKTAGYLNAIGSFAGVAGGMGGTKSTVGGGGYSSAYGSSGFRGIYGGGGVGLKPYGGIGLR